MESVACLNMSLSPQGKVIQKIACVVLAILAFWIGVVGIGWVLGTLDDGPAPRPSQWSGR